MGTLTTGSLILTDAKYNGDGFGRIRVSNPSTLFEVYFPYDKQPQKIQEIVSGSGTATFVNGLSFIDMSVSSSAGSVVRQSKEYIPYQPGKSKLIFLSGVLSTTNPLPSNITTRIGHFDSAIDKTAETNPIGNGHFFEMVGGNVPILNVVERSFFNSSLGWGTETRVPQSAWNTDTLNGAGGPGNPSGISINFNLDNVFVIDMQWLGVGQVRMGIFYNNQIYYCHKFNVLNRPSSFDYNNLSYNLKTTPYTQFGKLPIRYEIVSTSNAPGNMRMICSTVLSEGGYIPSGIPCAVSSGTAAIIPSINNYTVLLAIRINPLNPRITLKINGFRILLTGTNDVISYRLELNPTISNGSLSYQSIHSDFTYGQYALGNGTTNASNGYLLDTGTLTNSTNNFQSVSIENLSILPTILSDIAGNSDIIVLSARTLTGSNVNSYCSMNILGLF